MNGWSIGYSWSLSRSFRSITDCLTLCLPTYRLAKEHQHVERTWPIKLYLLSPSLTMRQERKKPRLVTTAGNEHTRLHQTHCLLILGKRSVRRSRYLASRSMSIFSHREHSRRLFRSQQLDSDDDRRQTRRFPQPERQPRGSFFGKTIHFDVSTQMSILTTLWALHKFRWACKGSVLIIQLSMDVRR